MLNLGDLLLYPFGVQKIRIDGSQTIPRAFERGQRELLGNHADIEVNQATARDIDADFDDREPQEKVLCGNPGQAGDPAVAEDSGDVHVVVQFVLKFGIAGPIQEDLEFARIVEGEGVDALGEEPHGQAVNLEDIVDGGAV